MESSWIWNSDIYGVAAVAAVAAAIVVALGLRTTVARSLAVLPLVSLAVLFAYVGGALAYAVGGWERVWITLLFGAVGVFAASGAIEARKMLKRDRV